MPISSTDKQSQASERVQQLISTYINRSGEGLYGITGSAGAGKSYTSTLVSKLVGASVYSADFRFIGNSIERRSLLIHKQERSISDYLDSVNQFNWWDWGGILKDLDELLNGHNINILNAYDRSSGNASEAHSLPSAKHLIFEGALLGPQYLVSKIKKIFFIYADPEVRFQRLIVKDSGRRSFGEICARFLITEYSETIYYLNLLKLAGDRIIFIDSATGLPRSKPNFSTENLFIPVRANPSNELAPRHFLDSKDSSVTT